MKIAILGSPFDPPHLGHQLIAQQILDFTDVDLVWLTPCYRHLFDKKLIPFKHRIAMAKTLLNTRIQYCGKEINNRLSGSTSELMELLKQKYSQHQFSFVIGSDNLKTFKKWVDWKKLLKTTRFLVFPRPEFDYSLKKYGLGNSQYQLKLIRHPLLVTIDISSTKVRERVKKGLSITHLVPKKIEKYIKKHNLYA